MFLYLRPFVSRLYSWLRPFLLVTFWVLLTALIPVATAQAASTRYVAPAGSDTNNDCANPSAPCATIVHAVDQAGNGNTIQLAVGIYTEVNIVISKTLTIVGEDQIQTIVQAHTDPHQSTGHVFITFAPITLQNFTIRHGYGSAVYHFDTGVQINLDRMIVRDNAGAGVYIWWGQGSITSSTFQNNGAGVYGDMASHIVVDNSRFIGNGSGVEMYEESELTVTNSFFNSNGTGLAIVDAQATIVNCVINHNYMGVYQTNDDYVLRIQNSQISYNEGNGIYEDHGFSVVENTTIAGNGDNGIYLEQYSNLTLLNSTVNGNSTSTNGGGIFSSTGYVVISNSTISGNKAHLSGGGIYQSGRDVMLNNVTITKNIADFDRNGTGDGGGVYSTNSDFILKNSIIAGNRDGSSSTDPHDCSGTLISQNYNLIQTMTGCLLTGATDHNLIGVSPLLGQLTHNGGPTKTHALLIGSPAINAGNPVVPGSGGNACELTDQRGELRDAFCDIGAFEVE